MPEIKDKESLEAWLATQAVEVATAISIRSAMRVWPLLLSAFDGDVEAPNREIILPCSRLIAVGFFATNWSQRAKNPIFLSATNASARAASDAAFISDNELPTDVVSSVVYSMRSAIDAVGHAFDHELAVGFASEAVAYATTYSSADSKRRSIVWDQVQRDVDFFRRRLAENTNPRVAVQRLARIELWHPANVPTNGWATLKRELLQVGEGWKVWTDLYDFILKGARAVETPGYFFADFSSDFLTSAVIRDQEDTAWPEDAAFEIATLPNEDWEQGPAYVNAKIAAILEKHATTPPISDEVPLEPEPRPSPITFELRGGVLHKVEGDAPKPPDARRFGAEQAWRALTELLDDFMLTDPGRNNPKLGRVLGRCRAAMGSLFAEVEIYTLGVHAARLDGMAARADEFLMAEDAADLVALNAQFSLFMAQFPEWADYASGLSEGFGSPEAEENAVIDAAAALNAMATEAPGLMEPETAEDVAALREAAIPEPYEEDPEVLPLNRRSYLRAARDAFAKLAGDALEAVRTGAMKAIEKKAEASTAGLLAAASGWLLALATGLPAEFGWLSGVLTYLARMLGPSKQDKAAKSVDSKESGPDDDIANA